MALQTDDFLADLLGGMTLAQKDQHMVDSSPNKRKVELTLRKRQESPSKKRAGEPVVSRKRKREEE